MFTGIIEETGTVAGIDRTRNGISLTLQAGRVLAGTRRGDSIAVNGCCLTVASLSGSGARKTARFDLLEETWSQTTFQFLQTGAALNLERSLQIHQRLHGHFVTGHIDGMGKIVRWERVGSDYLLEVDAPNELLRHVVKKGSIAVDGISLTVAALTRKTFRVWIIPHTHDVTALRERERGDAVNLETDILAKYVERAITVAKGGGTSAPASRRGVR